MFCWCDVVPSEYHLDALLSSSSAFTWTGTGGKHGALTHPGTHLRLVPNLLKVIWCIFIIISQIFFLMVIIWSVGRMDVSIGSFAAKTHRHCMPSGSRWPSGHCLPSHFSLTHGGRDKMYAISQTTSSSAFSWMKMYEFLLTFHWSLFLRVQLTMLQHWFR